MAIAPSSTGTKGSTNNYRAVLTAPVTDPVTATPRLRNPADPAASSQSTSQASDNASNLREFSVASSLVDSGITSIEELYSHDPNAINMLSAAQLADLQQRMKKRSEIKQDPKKEEEEDDEDKLLMLGGEAAAGGGAAMALKRLWHHIHHRLRALLRLLIGKRIYRTVTREATVARTAEEVEAEARAARELREGKTLATEARTGAELTASERTVAELKSGMQTAITTNSTERTVMELEHGMTSAANAARTGTELNSAMRGVRTMETVSHVSRKGLWGTVLSLTVLPLTASIAFAKTAPVGMSQDQIMKGVLKTFGTSFTFLNKDWLEAFGKGDVVDGMDKFFGVSDSVRLVKLAYNDPAAFKKEIREMADGTTQFAQWAKDHPAEFNKLVQDPEKYMADPKFAQAVGTAAHQGLEGNKAAAQASALEAVTRGQTLSHGNYKSTLPSGSPGSAPDKKQQAPAMAPILDNQPGA